LGLGAGPHLQYELLHVRVVALEDRARAVLVARLLQDRRCETRGLVRDLPDRHDGDGWVRAPLLAARGVEEEVLGLDLERLGAPGDRAGVLALAVRAVEDERSDVRAQDAERRGAPVDGLVTAGRWGAPREDVAEESVGRVEESAERADHDGIIPRP